MNLRQALTFVTVAELGTVSKAALRLRIADSQQPRRPDRQSRSECTIGSVEQRLDCMGRELARQRVEMFMPKWQLESLRSPRVEPLRDAGRLTIR